jgi:L-alanine-DL-glutamate epimerase-like enolase superfamily enzyme
MSGPTLDSVTASAYRIPTDAPEADGTAAWDATTIVVVHAQAGQVLGTGWTYAPAAASTVVEELLAPAVLHTPAHNVPGIWAEMVRVVRNATRAGLAGYAISAVDVALWDLKARLLGLPLADLFGVVNRDVPVYGSGGFTSYPDDHTVRQLTGWVRDQNIGSVKIKVGQDRGHRVDRDIHRIQLARNAIGPSVHLFIDANGAYTAKQAIRVYQAVATQNVTWFEEPVSSDDLDGLHQVRQEIDADVAAGEYGTDITNFRRMCAATAVDCLQVDATRCGGYTEWFRAAAVAASHGLQVSAHCAPNLHAHAAAATQNLRHIEWFHDHIRIESMLFDGALDPIGGTITPRADANGHGMTLRAERAAAFQVVP